MSQLRLAWRGGSPRGGGHGTEPDHAPPSPPQFVPWLPRLETVGLSLMLLAVGSAASIVSGPGPLNGLVQAMGFHVFSLALALLVVGAAVWLRRVPLLTRYPRFPTSAALLITFTAGFLGPLPPHPP